MTEDRPDEWAQAVGLFTAPPRYVPASVCHVRGDKLLVVFDGDKLHISRAASGAPVETITLPDGLMLCREVR